MRILNRFRTSFATAFKAPPIGSEIRQPLFASSNIRGSVDGIRAGEIRGWIIDESDKDRYIKLCLIANGRFVEKTSTCVFRKDLEQKYQSKGLHGFAFGIPQNLLSTSEISVEIRLEDGRQFFGPEVVRNPEPHTAVERNPRKPCLLLMHIPKTAVTAVRSAIREDALTDRQLWLYGEAPGLPVEHLLCLTETQLHRVECVIGHFYFGLHTLLPQLAVYATVLRDPVERCISYYFHERTKSSDPGQPACNLTLDEFVRHGMNSQYDNLMVRMFTGKPWVPAGSVNRDMLKEAVENLHQRFCYVGLQQRTSAAVESIADYLKIRPNPLQLENLGSYDRQTCASHATLRRLREFNQFDMELFDYVQKRFWCTNAEGWVDRRMFSYTDAGFQANKLRGSSGMHAQA